MHWSSPCFYSIYLANLFNFCFFFCNQNWYFHLLFPLTNSLKIGQCLSEEKEFHFFTGKILILLAYFLPGNIFLRKNNWTKWNSAMKMKFKFNDRIGTENEAEQAEFDLLGIFFFTGKILNLYEWWLQCTSKVFFSLRKISGKKRHLVIFLEKKYNYEHNNNNEIINRIFHIEFSFEKTFHFFGSEKLKKKSSNSIGK